MDFLLLMVFQYIFSSHQFVATLHKQPPTGIVDASGACSASKVDILRVQNQHSLGARPASTASAGAAMGPQDPDLGTEKLSRLCRASFG
jgi:hypothetical protein